MSELAHRLTSITATLGHTRSLQLALIAATAVSLASLSGLAASSLVATPEFPAARASTAPPAVDKGALAAAQLFGTASAPREAPPATPPPRPGWVLQGVFTGATPDAGSAIITAEQRPAQLFQAGEQLPGGGTLVAVYPDRVALDFGGARHTLQFPSLGATGRQGSSPTVSAAARSATRPLDPTAADSEQRRELVRKRLEMLRQRALGSS